MTNETTASQPKVAAPIATILYSKDFQDLIESITGIDLAEECDESSDMVKALRELISVIDNFSAPAAQASATIQAAPWPREAMICNECNTDRLVSPCPRLHNNCPMIADAHLAANIQEPVMVAEPVNVDKMIASGPMGIPSAAPMVADPAGVEEWREVMQELVDLVDDAYEGNYEIDSFTAQPARILLAKVSEAATVKAVPSEAQPPYPEGDVAGPCVCGSWPGGKCLKCPWVAAPLADKTGGGE